MDYYGKPWPMCTETQENLVCRYDPDHEGEHQFTHWETALEMYYA